MRRRKTVGLFLAVAMFATLLCATVTKGFTDFNPYGWFKTECEHVYEDGECIECGEKEVAEENNESAGA